MCNWRSPPGMPIITGSFAWPLATKSEYFIVERAEQMYSSNLLLRSSSLPRYLS